MAVLTDWIDSPGTLAQWGGPLVTWPVRAEDLWQQIEVAFLPSFALDAHGELQAFGQLAPRENITTWHLCRLIVAPHRRGQRLGEQLCDHLIAQAINRGATRVTLNVATDNQPALRLYQRLGFASAGPVSKRGIQPMARQL
ncbi:GNAT family N-acetyltransferase [Kushneria sp. Sum13]|uniref:GNAT family N-acetyltransferase n=1 Tax=Kushneria sp. Sum13 TaxID=3459196 RepID=UPI00404640F4